MRAALAIITGLLVWAGCAIAFDFLLRAILPGYHAAEPTMDFTLAMMLGRLALPGALPSLVAGFVTATIAPGRPRVITILAVILVVVFLPSHYYLWNKFPLWYHVTFLGSLILLTSCGARLQRALRRAPL
jgi:hypothetical protein